jgi:LruC domain-containing protein
MFKLRSISVLVTSVIVFVVSGCDLVTPSANDEEYISLSEQEFPADFNYNTKRAVDFTIKAATPTQEVLAGVKINVFGLDSEGAEYQLFTAFTNEAGLIEREYPLASIMETVVIRTDYPGLMHELEWQVHNNQVMINYGEIPADEASADKTLGKSTGTSDLHFLSTFNTHGKPFDLVTPQDPIRQEFLNDVDISLPEGLDIAVNKPEYLASGSETNTVLSQAADVWVTYFHEGTSRKNVLGFYHYPVDDPPATTDDIDSITIIFPNASYPGGGGNLQPGDKMHIGNFPPNTEIGWVLFSDGWVNQEVTLGEWQFFSEPSFNPENDLNIQQHTILLYDNARDITVLGFEDENRESGSDNDFNDVLFYITSNPRNAISSTNVTSITYTGEDADEDGVADHVDSYPNDPQLAYENYYPSQSFFGSFAFEDLWPSRGDYDFNDMVIDYQFKELMNANNQVVQVDVALILKAVGASYENGFGFELEATPDQIQAVTGMLITGSSVTLSGNGSEAGQDKAVVVAFDKSSNVLERPSGSYLNTQIGAPLLTADTLRLSILFNEPLDQALVGIPPYNPFIIIDQDREKEVHLPGYAPTTLAMNSGLFNTSDDNSSGSGYYKTSNNLPWALDIFQTLDYPVERAAIDSAHIYFVEWAKTRGQSYNDWYQDLPGYRRAEKIFQR